jgi:CHAT domain-containing protein/tetratricopeptide (TPR) repeat protein
MTVILSAAKDLSRRHSRREQRSFAALRMTVVLLLLACPLAAQRDVDVAAREFIRLAYDGQFAQLAQRWAGESTGKGPFETPIRNALRVRCLYVDAIRTTISQTDASTATANAVVALRTDDGTAPETMRLNLRLARSGDRWLVTAVELPDQALAAKLIAASPEERTRLLAENADAMTKNLARTIYRRSVQLLLQPDPRPAEPLGVLARDVAILAGDRGGESLAKGMIGIVARLTGRRDESLRLTRESLEIAEESRDALAITRAHLNLNHAVGAFDRFSPQLDRHLEAALAMSKRADDPSLELRVLAQLKDEAQIRQDLVTTRRYIDLIARRLAETGDPFNDLHAQNDIGLVQLYLSQHDYDLALHHADSLLRRIEGQNSWMQAFAWFLRGRTLSRLGRREEARRSLAQALQLADVTSDSQILLSAYNDFATVVAEDGDLNEAECYLRRSGAIAKRIGYKRTGEFHRIVPHLIAANRAPHALALALEQAAGAVNEPEELSAALAAAALAYRVLGLPDRSLAAILESIESDEAFQERVAGSEIQRVRSAESIGSSYELAAELELARGNAAQALTYLDLGRGRVLHDLVRHGRPYLDQETDRVDLEKRREHEQRLATLNIELSRAGESNAAGVRARLETARRAYESFADGLRSRYDRRAATRPRIVSTDELAARIPDGVTMLVYAVRDDELHILTARRTAAGTLDVASATKRIARATLEARVDSLVTMLNSGDLRYRAGAAELYEWLIAPAERAIAGAEAICIVPDESLWRLPFAALVDGPGRFLIERMPIVYAPSISVYGAVAASRPSPQRRDAVRVLAVANPSIEGRRELAAAYRNADLGPLPDAEEEADALCALYGGARCTVLKRQRATESRTKVEIRDRGLVHFATHSLLDDRNPMYSRLVLARADEPADDGSLEAWEIAQLDLSTDLVVLSACDTARGRVGGGEGVVGMAWSFFVAGARSTLATQWRVETGSTADLMIAFHRALRDERGSLRKAKALRAAQLQMLRDAKRRHPFYWAAFVLLGDAS